jgi:hypothetical protein
MYARAVVAGGLLVIMAHLIADEPEPTRFAGAAVLLLAIGILLGVDLLSTIGRRPTDGPGGLRDRGVDQETTPPRNGPPGLENGPQRPPQED